MNFIIFGIVAFALFFLHDIAQLLFPYKSHSCFFYFGIFLLLIATAALACQRFLGALYTVATIYFWLSVSAFFCILLIYTLFFALPYNTTYRSADGARPLITDGVYALCRHPGILWFAGVYGALFAALGGRDLAIAFPLFSFLNLLYAILQDRCVFPRQFPAYRRYRQNTPFLIPTPASIARCVRTWPGRRADNRHQGGPDEF